MASSSRGLGLAWSLRFFSSTPSTARQSCADRPAAQIARAIRRSPIIQAARNLQTSARLQAPNRPAEQSNLQPRPLREPNHRACLTPFGKPILRGTPKPSNGPPEPLATLPFRATTPSTSKRYGPLIRHLAGLNERTVLYQSASHFWLRFSSISAAAFCITYAAINYYYNIQHPPPGLAWYVPVSFSLVCVVMGMLGYLFLVSTALSVRSITAVPTASLPKAYLQRGAAKMSPAEERAFEALQASPLALECEVGGSLPLMGARKIIAAPSEVVTSFMFQQAPVAHGVVPSGNPLLSMRRGLLAEGFAPIMIKGKRYKIDVWTGTLFKKGQGLEHVMPYKPEKFSDTWVDRLLKR